MDVSQLALQDGLFSFSTDLYKAVSAGTGNVFISPQSVCSALMLVCLGAGGNTQKQILAALGLGSIDGDVHEVFKKATDSLFSPNTECADAMEINLANKIFAARSINISDHFTKSVTEYYQGGVEMIDFQSKPEECRKHINTWVEQQTKEKIKDLLIEGTITARTNMVLANAIYFKGKWAKPFSPEKTESKDFFTSASDTVKVQMMRAEVEARFVEDSELGLSMVALPYQGGYVNMILLLPQEADGLARIEQNLSSERLAKLCRDVNSGMKFKVDLGVPKFSLTETYDLTNVLPSLGVKDLFDTSCADLSALSADDTGCITDVIHKSFIEVTEEGTEAAAATAMISRMMMMPMGNVSFICDRPFLFLLMDVPTNMVLFIGRYAQPSK